VLVICPIFPIRPPRQIDDNVYLLPDVTARGAHVVEFHARLGGSLLRLEEYGFVFAAVRTNLVDPWQLNK